MTLSKLVRTMKEINSKDHKVVRVTKTEFELENGDIYPIPFELDYTPSVEEMQSFIDDSKSIISKFVKQAEKEKEKKDGRKTP